MAYTARTTALPRGFGFSPYLFDSVGSASVITAASGRTVTFLSSGQLPQGFYEVQVVAGLSGNAALADLGNMVLQNGVTTLTSLLVTTTTLFTARYYLSCSGTDSLAIVAGFGATAGTPYMASLVATAMHPGA